MDTQARKKLLEGPWQPKTYTPQELVSLLRISPHQAVRIIADCNAGDPGEEIWLHWVNHHDLCSYLRDLVTPAEIPEDLTDLSVHGQWLVKQGWGLDPTRTHYRWIDPEDPQARLLLKAALSIALARISPPPPTEKPERDPNIIDAEWSFKK